MLNCITADLGRVLKKKSVIIWFVIEILLVIGGAVVIFFLNKAGFEMGFALTINLYFTMATVLIGIPVFLAVFKDDLQARAMQNAIGMGVSRDQVVLARFIEISIIYVISFVILAIVTFAAGIPFSVKMSEYLAAYKDAGIVLLKLICYSAISMIVVFGTMNTSFAQTIFLMLNLGIVSSIIGTLSFIPFLAKHNIKLEYATIDGLIGLANDSSFAAAPLMWVVIIGAFLVLPLILTIMIFRRKELNL